MPPGKPVQRAPAGSRSARPADAPPSGPGIQCESVVSYYRKMFRGKVYPLTLRISGTGSNGPVVEVHPVIPGALVSPATVFASAKDGAKATFHVTPLASGKLPDARVEVRSRGRLLNEIPLKMKAKAGRGWLFKLFCLLTVLLPCLFYYHRYYDREFLQFTYMVPSTLPGESPSILTDDRGLERWMETGAARSAAGVPMSEWNLHDWWFWTLGFVKDPLVTCYKDFFMPLREDRFAALYVLAVMLAFLLFWSSLTGAARGRVRGGSFEVPSS